MSRARHTRTQDAAALVPAQFRTSVQRFSAEDGGVRGPSGADWADRLPRLLAEVLDDWHLAPVGEPRTGWTALVVPVERDGATYALKLVWPHIEARDEPLALRHWDGRGATRLVAADPGRGALRLEALDASRALMSEDVDTACSAAGTVFAELHVPAPPGLRLLSEFARDQVRQLEAAEWLLPRRLVERTAGLVRELTAEPACDATLVHTDLHYRNVLHSLPGSDRPGWLAIDPHPMAGHPGFEIQPLLRNRVDELDSGSAFRHLVRRRVEVTCEAAGIDEDEALAWTYVHTAMEARWAAGGDDTTGVSFNIALLKALDG